MRHDRLVIVQDLVEMRDCAKKSSHLERHGMQMSQPNSHMWYPPPFQNSEKKRKLPAVCPAVSEELDARVKVEIQEP